MDVTRSAPPWAHCHVDVIYLLRIKKGSWGLWYSGLGLHQLSSQPTFFAPRWTTHFCSLYKVCDAHGDVICVFKKKKPMIQRKDQKCEVQKILSIEGRHNYPEAR